MRAGQKHVSGAYEVRQGSGLRFSRGRTVSVCRTGAWVAVRQNGCVYFTDRGIEELERRRGDEEVTLEWLAEQLRTFVDLNPEFEAAVDRLATWLARVDDDED